MASTPFTMMALFLGSRGQDLYALLLAQAVLALLSCLVVIVVFAGTAKRFGPTGAMPVLWQNIPGWMVFVVLSANSLVLIAEMSLLLLNALSEEHRPLFEHVPVVAALCSSVALALVYGFRAILRYDN
jgi:hypothetical protein